jgi:hypothetical protein
VEAIPWSVGKSTLSRPLLVELATWSRLLAWDVVAKLYGVSWATVVSAEGGACSEYVLELVDSDLTQAQAISEVQSIAQSFTINP